MSIHKVYVFHAKVLVQVKIISSVIIDLWSEYDEQDMNVLVGDKKERLDINIALSNSLAFRGQNSSIVFAFYNNLTLSARFIYILRSNFF